MIKYRIIYTTPVNPNTVRDRDWDHLVAWLKSLSNHHQLYLVDHIEAVR